MFHLCYDHQTEKETDTNIKSKSRTLIKRLFALRLLDAFWCVIWCSMLLIRARFHEPSSKSLASTGSNQAYRTISIGQLNALLRLHLRPIDVVVYYGPQGYLVLRGASRLDAFSGYPFRT